MTEITSDVLTSLATKLESLDLASDEQAVLNQVLDRAAVADAETMGFVASEDELIGVASEDELVAFKGGTRPDVRAGLSPMALKLGKGAGLWG